MVADDLSYKADLMDEVASRYKADLVDEAASRYTADLMDEDASGFQVQSWSHESCCPKVQSCNDNRGACRYKADVMAVAASRGTKLESRPLVPKFLLFISDTKNYDSWSNRSFFADLRALARLFRPNFTSAR